MTRILVTDAAGCTGARMTAALVAAGDGVVALAMAHPVDHRGPEPESVAGSRCWPPPCATRLRSTARRAAWTPVPAEGVEELVKATDAGDWRARALCSVVAWGQPRTRAQ